MKHEPELALEIHKNLLTTCPTVTISDKVFPVTDDPRLAVAFEYSKVPQASLFAGSLKQGIENNGWDWLGGKDLKLAVYSKPAEHNRTIYTAELFGE